MTFISHTGTYAIKAMNAMGVRDRTRANKDLQPFVYLLCTQSLNSSTYGHGATTFMQRKPQEREGQTGPVGLYVRGTVERSVIPVAKFATLVSERETNSAAPAKLA